MDGIIAVVVIKDNLVDSMRLFDNAKEAEAEFKKLAQDNDPAWTGLSAEEKSSVLDEGYYEFGLRDTNSVCIAWPDLVSPRLAAMAAWARLLSSLENDDLARALLPVATGAAADAVLRELFPFMSHLALGFSRTQQYPHTRGLPFVTAIGDGRFKVQTAKREALATGTAEQALAVVKAAALAEVKSGAKTPKK